MNNTKIHSKQKTIKSFDGIEIYYEVTEGQKNKKCLLFLHGMGGDLSAWNDEREYFSDLGYPTLSIDLRGHGLSGRASDKESYELVSFVKDVKAVIKAEKIHKPIIIGHCFGGMVALLYAALYTDALSALILIDSSYKAPDYATKITNNGLISYIVNVLVSISPETFAHGHTDFKKYENTSDFYWKRIAEDISHVSLKSYLYICQNLCEFNAESLLTRINVPTLIIEGEDDTVYTKKDAQHLNRGIRKSILSYVPHQNHMIIINHSHTLNETIEKFLHNK